MKSYRIVPRAPDDETPVDFPDETSPRGDQPGGLAGHAENNHANIGGRQINASRYARRTFRMEQLTRLRQLYTYKYLLTRIKHARAYRPARYSNKDFCRPTSFRREDAESFVAELRSRIKWIAGFYLRRWENAREPI